jgi:uracil-DNA glycosylase family 4
LREALVPAKAVIFTKNATTVFGEGPAGGTLCCWRALNQEDRQGRPFVGPAGRLLDKALAEVRIPRATSRDRAVKHFKWIWRGKRRLHQKPSIRQVACRPWLEAELRWCSRRSWFAWVQRRRNLFWPGRCSYTKERGKFIASVPIASFYYHPSLCIYRHREKEEQEEYDVSCRDKAGPTQASKQKAIDSLRRYCT